ncbi:MAG: hypothetical protein Q7S03_01175 [bacterium]|nr:hypothetical protein [bacterium]
MEEDAGSLAGWVMQNAGQMKERMFFDPKNDWLRLTPFQVLVLRACAPRGVFSQSGRVGYLSQVGGDENLSEIAEALFSDDYGLLEKLPTDLKPLRGQLAVLMELAYRNRIRGIDPRVTVVR